MQESSCTPNAVGGAGEQGLMQITPEKCKNAPNHNCQDIVSIFCARVCEQSCSLFIVLQDYNIGTAAKYFADLLDQNCGDVIATIGGYNGWKLGMTQVGDESLTESIHLTRFGLGRCYAHSEAVLQMPKHPRLASLFLRAPRDSVSYTYF